MIKQTVYIPVSSLFELSPKVSLIPYFNWLQKVFTPLCVFIIKHVSIYEI